MTLNEFIEWANKNGSVAGDMKLRVQAFGGMRGGKDIEFASVGFDWDHGAIILHPKVALTIKEKKP